MYNHRYFKRVKETIKIKTVCITAVFALLLSGLPLSVAALEEPSLGQNKNAADFMTVTNNGTDATKSFKETGTVPIAANTRGYFGNIYYTGNTCYFSADMRILNDSSSYGSVRMVLGYCTFQGRKQYIELCIRPNINGQSVFFLNGGGEYPVKVGTAQPDIKIGETYHYTAMYENGAVSYWANGVQVFNNVTLPSGATDINLEPGFYSQNCGGEFSDIAVWGTMEEITEPVFDTEKDLNLIYNVVVNDKVNDTTYKPADCKVQSPSNLTNRTVWNGIHYNKNTYKLSASAAMYDNTENASYNWEGLIFKVATAKKGGKVWEIEIRVRSGIVVLFARDDTEENAIEIKDGIATPFDSINQYSVYYRNNNTIDFWKNSTALYYRLDLKTFGYTDITPCAALGGEICAFEYSDIKFWGDGISVENEPKFDTIKDTNIMPLVKVGNPLDKTMACYPACALSSTSGDTCRYTFSGITYAGNYKLSANAVMYDNTATAPWGSEYNFEGIILKIGKSTLNGKNCTIEVRARKNGFFVFAVYENQTETVLTERYGYQTNFMQSYSYTVEFKNDGKFDIWQNGTLIFYNYDVTALGCTAVTPDTAVGGEVCSFGISDIKLWGDGLLVEADPEPEPEPEPDPEPKPENEPKFNASSDKNVMPFIVISNPVSRKSGKSADCSAVNTEKKDCRMKFLGAEYSGSYNFSADALMYDNTDIAASGSEYNYEGVIFAVGKSQKDGKDCTIEIRARKSAFIVYALINGGGEKVLGEYYGFSTGYGKKNSYTISFNGDATFDLWQNGVHIIRDFDVTKSGYKAITPEFSVGGEVCAYEVTNMKLWGNVNVPTAPKFNAKTMKDLIKQVVVNDVFSGKLYKLTNGTLSSDSMKTGRIDFSGVKVLGNYTFFANASFKDNKTVTESGKEYDWEGIIFRSACAEKNGKKYTIELRVRRNSVLVYAVDSENRETLLADKSAATQFSSNAAYVIDYKNGKLDLWQDDVCLLKSVDPVQYGFKNVFAAAGLGGEVCSFSFTDMHLVNSRAGIAASVPQMPEVNTDYSGITEITVSGVLSYADRILKCTDDKSSPKAIFCYLPFSANDSYVFGGNVTVKKAEKNWMGPRFIIGLNSKNEEIALFFTASDLIVAEGSTVTYKLPFKRELNTDYRIDMLVEPRQISVWVNNILLIDKAPTSIKKEVQTAVLFENAAVTVKNINMYHIYPTQYTPPVKPAKPVLKTLGANQYNAAEYAKMLLDDKDFGGYFNCRLLSSDSTAGKRYLFKDLPINNSQSFYYSSDFKVTESSENWKGPRYIFRRNSDVTMYCAITHSSVLILANGDVLGSSPFALELGKKYSIVIYSTPDSVSVWLDGQMIFENTDLSAYANVKTLEAKPGILFELCQANVTNIALYGDSIVFDPQYVDMELYNDSFFRMQDVPAKPEGAVNLFENVEMQDNSTGSLGASYEKETRNFKNDYCDVKEGLIRFVDTTGSSNLNGLKNGSSYALSFNYTLTASGTESTDKDGLWFICNASTAPWLTAPCNIQLGICPDALKLCIFKDGVQTSKQETEFAVKIGHQYKVSVVHGKNWIKLYMDNELVMVSTDLPLYNLSFDYSINETACSMTDFNLYELSNTGLTILETKQIAEKTKAGNSVLAATEYKIEPDSEFPLITVILLGALLLLSSFAGVYVFIRRKRVSGKGKQAV